MRRRSRSSGVRETQQANGFGDVRFVDRKEALEIVPALNDRASAASYSPRDGQADPALTTRAFAVAAERHGASYWTGTDDATALIATDSRVTGVQTSRGDVQAEVVVLAAGAWSDDACPVGWLPICRSAHGCRKS